MRIVLHWGASSGLNIVDSHITGPDNHTGRFHIYWNTTWAFYYATNAYTCGSCTESQKADNVTLDNDDDDGAPGTETITINKVRSGTYRYSVHDFSNKGLDAPDNLSKSGATVIVYYNDTTTTYNVPNSAGSLWTVFTFDSSSGFTAVNGMSDQLSASNIQYY